MRINFNPINRFTFFVVLCLFTIQYALAQKPTTPSAKQISAKVDEYMDAAVKVERFSGSILVARNGSPVVSKGYGMANYEQSVPNTPQTVFRLASITKQFTAAAVMILQERGKLNTNHSVCKYFSDCPTVWQPMTIRHLLTQTSGIVSYTGLPELQTNPSIGESRTKMLDLIKSKPLEFVPGEQMKYGNSYFLLGLIIERASGKTYGEFLQENIFTPLGMKQSGYDDIDRIAKNRAAGYWWRGDSFVTTQSLSIFNTFAGGGLSSTTEDLLLWDKALYTKKLLSRKSRDEMFAPFKELTTGRGYAYGWYTTKRFDRQEVAHGGNLPDFINYIARFPAERVTVIVLGNSGNGSSGRIANDLSAIVFGAPYKIPRERVAVAVAASVLDKYVGQYQVQLPPITFTITNENGKLMAQRDAQRKTEMFAESETDFFIKTADVQFTFVKDANGRVTGLDVHQGDSTLYGLLTGQKIK